jgi:hypothetical protein
MHSTAAAKLLRVGCLVFGLVAWLPCAQAADFVFDTGDTTLPAGTGERLIDAFFPQLAGRNMGPALQAQLQPSVTNLANTLKADIDAKLNGLNFAPLVSRSATAGAAAARATSVDHASFIKMFSLTAAGSAAVTGFDGLKELTHPSEIADNIGNGIAPNVGIGAGASAMLGFNFGALHLPRLKFFNPNRLQLYVSAMYINLTYNGDEFLAKTQNYGAHVKYQLLAPDTLTANALVRWGGLNVASGLTWAGTDLGFHLSLPSGNSEQTVPVAMGGVTENLTLKGVWTGDAQLNARMRAYTVPLEVSSFIQLLYVFTLFGGVAMDLNFGHFQMDASARAPLAISASTPSSTKSVDVLTPTPSLTYLLKKSPVHIDGRAFLGLQLNAGVVAVYAQGMIDTSQTVMASVGLRGFY